MGAESSHVANSVNPDPRSPIPDDATLVDLVEYAAVNNPGLEASFQRWKASLERIPQVQALPDPRFTYGYFVKEVETRVGPQEQTVGLAQRFPWFGKLRLRGDVAFQASEAARQKFDAERLRLVRQVKDAYYEYSYVFRDIEVTEEMVGLLESLEGTATADYRAGAGSYADLIRIQVELEKLRDRLRTAEDLRRPMAARLNGLLNRSVEAPLPTPESIPSRDFRLDAQALRRRLIKGNPELASLDATAAKEGVAVDLAKKDFYPDFTVGVDYIDTDEARMPDALDSGKDPVKAMVSLNLPIWRGKIRAGIREAERRRSAAFSERKNAENRLLTDLDLAFFRFRDAERKISLYRETLIPKAEQSLKVSRESYRAGEGVFLDLIDSERTLLDFRLAYERAFVDRAQRLAEIEMLVGGVLPDDEDGSEAIGENRAEKE